MKENAWSRCDFLTWRPDPRYQAPRPKLAGTHYIVGSGFLDQRGSLSFMAGPELIGDDGIENILRGKS